MCGIAALIAPAAARYRPHMEAMIKELAHRGPDGRGIWADENCCMGHVRLSVIDPAGGAQPMSGPYGTIVFNGEIYNFREERTLCEYPFVTESDTEYLLAAYEKYGADMCRRLKGMFAFAIWDGSRLICGRDRFGEKPLYYATGAGGAFIVASEPQAILASGLITPHVDRLALAAWLRMGWFPEGMTIFREIRQLLPGHILVHENGALKTECFWEPPAPASFSLSLEEAGEEFRRLMDRAVERCLVADVETGLLLSGGLDSTTIALVAAEKSRPRSFAFAMDGERNELPYAAAAAKQYGLPLEKCHIADMDFPALMLELPAIYGEPLADTSCLPTLMLCRHVAASVKCALGGDGGDELLGGYGWYKGLAARAAHAGPVSNGWTRHAAAHFQGRSLCDSPILREAGLEPWYPHLPTFMGDTCDDALRMDLTGFLPSDVLKKTDRAAMSRGLEIRSPFLDGDLADFLISLPAAMKVGGNGKLVMRHAFGDKWPEVIRKRPKQGFGMDASLLLRRPDMRELANTYLYAGQLAIHAILPKAWFGKYAKRGDTFSWALLVLSIWCQYAKQRGWLNAG